MNQQYTPKISVLVAIYNVGKYLNECLDSLKNQTLKEAEFILVDDCSTDNSLEICYQYAESDHRFKVVRHMENKGLLLVRKTGILNARGKYCIFLDGDDFLYSNDALEFITKSMDGCNSDLIFFQRLSFQDPCSCNDRKFHLEMMDESQSKLSSRELLCDTYSSSQKLFWVITSKCFRREVLTKASKFIPDQHLVCAEDAFLSFITGALVNHAVLSKNKPIYAYRNGSGISTSKATITNIKRHAEQLTIIPWLKKFIHDQELSQFHYQLVDILRDKLCYGFLKRLDDIDDENVKLSSFRVLFSPELSDETSATLLGLIKTPKDIKKIRRYDRVAKFIPWLRI